MSVLSHIAAIPLFSNLSATQLQDLALIVIDQTYNRGQIIFMEGDEGKGLFVLISGKVKVYKFSPEGREQIIHIFGPGEPFAEAPVFAGQRFPANAEALEESRIFFFPRTRFLELIRRHPSLAMNMLAVLSKRLYQLAALIEDLSLKEVSGRLAAYVLFQSDQKQGATEYELDISKGQLAGLLGSSPETLSRVLGRMAREGLIESKGPMITILNKAGLRQLAVGTRRL
ncbi:Crp/Fnr family transcriptional regulator [Desulfobacca acetoxidans]|uniref:Transcriptional regulator, Crp/Fnr family n=1 Tax=Desulfobacca acetoxidans (strain ATCC 700848 / DSM 11109 / ASRB2) TaxID=880072 RepID=F2NHI8_DESAR|nr:Crp/Fnr family transcriptional regulator [Desulfobacca acetoxidans]AEB09175.1 transcriptional regulator, Crp/Fnr family [Desulfobacca acetoxidans DSM 11109]